MSSNDFYPATDPTAEPARPSAWTPDPGPGVAAPPAPQWGAPPAASAPQWGAAPAAPAPQWANPTAPTAAPVPQWATQVSTAPAGYAQPNPYGAPTYGGPAQAFAGGPIYAAPPVGAPMYAPTPVKAPTNGAAIASFVLALVMLVFGLVTGFYFGSLFVILLGVRGIQKAKALEATGFGPRGRALAWCGLVIGVLDFVIVMALKVTSL